ncbi:HD-GYP domain-containing protein [Thiobaca trueperi]|uniref:Putative nucleotidyltransferase with HDIG domain n=1 Tax=Thiobaca trueperi TaxID=127458 RepID=A0A4R3N1V4_9GAMM|nr:HD-GYP domain-containing protein [Thiobaca trueperi]TCT22081.1 putative nucleotidyltransferase with HDIG domain [Thiobaca trueperi]
MNDTQAQFVDVDALCVGMYIYLDLGWIGHPFALNHFKIVDDGQIETIRGLGLTQVRWSPERSDLPSPASPAPVAEDAASLVRASDDRRQRLLDQRLSLDRCEREFSGATRAFRDILKLAPAQPEAAREQAETMVGDLVGKLLDQGESCIRLLSEQAGDKSSLHAMNVTMISLLLGKSLGFDAAALHPLGLGALLHDFGKIALPERLRWRDDGFSIAERNLFQEHVAQGVELARRMGLKPDVCAIIAQHHEYVDGSGFPQRLQGDALSPASCIVGLVNHYDMLCNPANPVAALTPHQALSMMFAQSKKKFNAAILGAFIRMMGIYPPGSVVMLTDGRYALVVSVNSSRPLKPRVLIHDPRVPRDEALVIDLEDQPDLGIRQSLKPLQLPRAVFDYLSPRQRMCYFFERARKPTDLRDGQ